MEKSIRMANPWLHDWTIVFDERTYGIIQHDSGVPNCTVCLGRHFLDLPISAVTCVACLALMLLGVICAMGAVWSKIKNLQQARCSEPGDDALVENRRSGAPSR